MISSIDRCDVLSSPECPISASGAGPSPSELTACTLISNGVYVPVLFTKNGGDFAKWWFQCTPVPTACRHDTLYSKSGPWYERFSISCKDKEKYNFHLEKYFGQWKKNSNYCQIKVISVTKVINILWMNQTLLFNGASMELFKKK